MSKDNWWKDATYKYLVTVDSNGVSPITFTFPNAADGKTKWTTWLYRFKNGKVVEKNLEAEFLQCYIDKSK